MMHKTVLAALTCLALTAASSRAFAAADSIHYHDERRAEAFRAVAAGLAEMGHFNSAFESVGPRKLAEFLQILAEWAPCFERLKEEFSITILSEATGVAKWFQPRWCEIHRLLASSHASGTIATQSPADQKRSPTLTSKFIYQIARLIRGMGQRVRP
jgi:hypothetical protein